MKVVVPIQIQPANYAMQPAVRGYSNAPDYDEWATATVYALGDRVIMDSLQSTFECVSAHTSSAPTTPTLTMTTPWIRVGASNAWKPFDGGVSSQSYGYFAGDQTNASMTYRLTGIGRFTTVCVLSTDASSVRVIFTDQNGVVRYDEIDNAVDTTPIIDAWTYCFADCNVQRDFVFDGIDGWGSTAASILDVRVYNDATGLPVQVGEIIAGVGYELGDCHAEPSMGLVDYSKKEANAFGEYSLVERAYSQQANFDIEIPTARRNSVQSLVAKLRATPCVYFPTAEDANNGLVIYGFPTDFEITYHTKERAYATLQIEGLT